MRRVGTQQVPSQLPYLPIPSTCLTLNFLSSFSKLGPKQARHFPARKVQKRPLGFPQVERMTFLFLVSCCFAVCLTSLPTLLHHVLLFSASCRPTNLSSALLLYVCVSFFQHAVPGFFSTCGALAAEQRATFIPVVLWCKPPPLPFCTISFICLTLFSLLQRIVRQKPFVGWI